MTPVVPVESTSGLQRQASTSTEAFAVLYADCWTRMCRVAAGVLSGDTHAAEEVVQHAFIETWQRWWTIDNHPAYLRRSVVNRAIDVGRSKQRDRTRDQLLWADRSIASNSAINSRTSGMAPESAPPGSALELLDALSGLRPEFRAVLVLKYWARYSETEIASTMDVRPGTVKTWTRRALAQLRSQSDVWGTKSVAIGEPGNPVDDATDTTTDRAENDIRTATNAESER